MTTQIRIPQSERLQVLNKYGCKCAYCGNALTISTLKLDNTPDSIYPSCMRCKRRKGSKSIEQYREHILLEYARLVIYSTKFNLCEDFGMVIKMTSKVLFHFEKCAK